MKALKYAIVVVVASVFAALSSIAGTVLPLPGTSGPSLGDTTTNLYTVMQGAQNNQLSNFWSFTTISVVAGQTTSTQLQYGMNFLTAATGATTTMVLPTAKPGTEIFIANNTGQGVALFGSASPFTAGGQDFINGTIGNTLNAGGSAYGIGNGKSTQCFVPQGGNWWCSTGQ